MIWSCLLNPHCTAIVKRTKLPFLDIFFLFVILRNKLKVTLSIIIGLVVGSTPLVRRLTSAIILRWQGRRWLRRRCRMLLIIRIVSLCRTIGRSSRLGGVRRITAATAVACAARRRHITIAGVLSRVLDGNRHKIRATMQNGNCVATAT